MEKNQRENGERGSGWERQMQKKSEILQWLRERENAIQLLTKRNRDRVRKMGGETVADREMYSWESSTAIPGVKGAMK